MYPVVVLAVVRRQHAHGLLGDAAHLLRVRVVEPDVALRDAERGGRAMEHDGLEPVDGQARVGPAPPPHQVLSQVPILAARAGVPVRVCKITCKLTKRSKGRGGGVETHVKYI